MVLTTYGRSTGFCVDPIEKKPLNHFLPGTSGLVVRHGGLQPGLQVLSELGYFQIARQSSGSASRREPETIAEAAVQLGCHSVAFTYNDPVIWAEYAIDTARACRARGIKTVAVTAGYITPAARGAFFEVMDAANVDLKAFTEEFYQHLTYSHLQPVLDTLRVAQAGNRRLVRDHESDHSAGKRLAGRNPPHVRLDSRSCRRRSAGALHGVSSRLPLARPSRHAARHVARRLRHRPSRRESSTCTSETCTIRATRARTVPSVRRC